MVVPTATDVRGWSRVDLIALGYPDDDGLQDLVDQAVAYVEQVTGRAPLSAVPDALVPLAQQAVRMRVEQIAYQASDEAVEGATEELVQSFTTPGYSETRFAASQHPLAVVINAWRALNDVLLLLMTEEKRDDYIALITGLHAPAFETTQVDWQYDYLYWPSDQPPGWPGWGAS